GAAVRNWRRAVRVAHPHPGRGQKRLRRHQARVRDLRGRLMSPGGPVSNIEKRASKDTALELYRTMSKIHTCEMRVRKGLSSGRFGFSYWPVEGHEAMAAGAAVALGPDDQIVATYRGLADVVGNGVEL